MKLNFDKYEKEVLELLERNYPTYLRRDEIYNLLGYGGDTVKKTSVNLAIDKLVRHGIIKYVAKTFLGSKPYLKYTIASLKDRIEHNRKEKARLGEP